MAATLAFSSTLSRSSHQQPRIAVSGFIPSSTATTMHHNAACSSSFKGQSLRLQPRARDIRLTRPRSNHLVIKMMAVQPKIQFIQGTDEQTIPDVRLTKSRDGTNGMAIFRFDEPSVFDSSGEVGEITGFYMIDEEGVLSSVDVNAKFLNGKPAGVEAKYIMRTPRDWDRFMRFMERYSNANGLQFIKRRNVPGLRHLAAQILERFGARKRFHIALSINCNREGIGEKETGKEIPEAKQLKRRY